LAGHPDYGNIALQKRALALNRGTPKSHPDEKTVRQAIKAFLADRAGSTDLLVQCGDL
jgi:hypothetical protein